MKKEVCCEECGKKIEKTISEYNRNNRVGRRFFCSLSCSVIRRNKEHPKELRRKECSHLRQYTRRDEYTQFRFYTHVIRNRKKFMNRNKFVKSDIDEKYLKQLWEKQGGICPYSGWKLNLPNSINGWDNGLDVRSASLDRIDNSKGYVKGNVQFVSVMANYAKNSFPDKDLLLFCKSVVDYRCNPLKKDYEKRIDNR